MLMTLEDLEWEFYLRSVVNLLKKKKSKKGDPYYNEDGTSS